LTRVHPPFGFLLLCPLTLCLFGGFLPFGYLCLRLFFFFLAIASPPLIQHKLN